MASPDLSWLPAPPVDWRRRVMTLGAEPDWFAAKALAGFCLAFTATNALDAAARTATVPSGVTRARLAVLASSTSAHLAAGMRVAALRRGIALDIHEPDYGQYRQALADPRSAFRAFAPSTVLFALDAETVAGHARAATSVADATRLAESFVSDLRELWRAAREGSGATIIQQTVMPRLADRAGNNEHRLPTSGSAFIARVNSRLRDACDAEGVDCLALDRRVEQDGLDRWFSPASWHGAKQEVALPAAPMYGDLVARLIAARLGRSAKCCVFDLDNTLWGGVVGDEGPRGIVIGAGSAAGEAFLDLQRYALDLRARGILLAVCSKNDEANALAPFDDNPDMALKRGDFACFVANWRDKAANLREIAARLSIGLDSLVFVDDNPFERELVRAAAPEVFVPEVPDDPALVARCLADSGCFEMVSLTQEDRRRAELYAANAERESFRHVATDLQAYLAGLDMVLRWSRFAEADISRLTQLVNKTNQFNLTTRRLNESDLRAVMDDSRAAALQFRLLDRFGDNGVIGVVIGHREADGVFAIDDWLMSCRVLGRQVEHAVLNVVVAVARGLGASRIHATYRPSGRNAMVADLLSGFGFAMEENDHGARAGGLDLAVFTYIPTRIRLEEARDA